MLPTSCGRVLHWNVSLCVCVFSSHLSRLSLSLSIHRPQDDNKNRICIFEGGVWHGGGEEENCPKTMFFLGSVMTAEIEVKRGWGNLISGENSNHRLETSMNKPLEFPVLRRAGVTAGISGQFGGGNAGSGTAAGLRGDCSLCCEEQSNSSLPASPWQFPGSSHGTTPQTLPPAPRFPCSTPGSLSSGFVEFAFCLRIFLLVLDCRCCSCTTSRRLG